MCKTKMTLFAVILFGFTTAFSMENAVVSNEAAKIFSIQALGKSLNDFFKDSPERDRIFAKFEEYCQSAVCVHGNESKSLELLCVIESMLSDEMFKMIEEQNSSNKKK